jgi:alpha-maltose-1-phosphate synthase
MSKILLVAPALPVDVAAIARILQEAGLLSCLVTRYSPSQAVSRLLKKSRWTKRFSRRPNSPVDRGLMTESYVADIAFQAALVLTGSRTKASDLAFASTDRKARRRVVKRLGAVLGREDGCEFSFRKARNIGVKTVYLLPTAYWRRVRELMTLEEERFPGICSAAADERNQSTRRLDRKESELKLADHILCPSTFVRESLRSAPATAATVNVIPFGADESSPPFAGTGGKPIFLYAGNITMRKGIHRLLIAWKKLKAYRTHELKLIGDMFLTHTFLADFQGMFTHIPRMSREQLRLHYVESSAFLFNAVADGFGYVIPEAMSCGVPVIASKNSGAPDIIDDRSDGILIEYGINEQLEHALEWALNRPAELAAMGQSAREKAQQLTWRTYGEELVAWLRMKVLTADLAIGSADS